jgi:hypothetical protein
LEEIGRNWKKLEEIGKNWKKLEEIGKNWKFFYPFFFARIRLCLILSSDDNMAFPLQNKAKTKNRYSF